jgi:hypothetical protein
MRIETRARGFVVVIVALCGGCPSPLAGPLLMQAIVLDHETQEAALDVVTVTTPTDLAKGEGSAFTVLADVRFEKLLVGDVKDRSVYPDMDAFIAAQRERSGGRPPDLSFHVEYQGDDEVVVPDDYETLLVFSAWVAIERTLAYFEAIDDDTGATEDHLLVAQYGKVVGAGIPEGGADNAAFLQHLDMMFLDPVFFSGRLNGGLPFPMNEGVIAHELGHRMFLHNVWAGHAEDVWREDLGGTFDEKSTKMIKGLNEGIADVYAVGLTGNPAFGASSNLGDDRDLEGDFANELTYDALRAGDVEVCGTSEEFGTDFNFYCLGTCLAKTLWNASGRDATSFSTEVVPALRRGMNRFGENMQAAYEANDNAAPTIEPEMLLAPIVDELPREELRTLMCEEIATRWTSRASQVTSCP